MSNEILDSLFGEDESDETLSPAVGAQQIIAQICEIRQLPIVGGGRGLFAKCNIPVGTLIVAEVPVQTWEGKNLDDHDDLFDVLEAVLMNEKAYKTTQQLHPISIEQADVEEIQRIEGSLTEERVATLLSAVAQSRLGAEGRDIDKTEIVRVLLTLQHNGFNSGLYGALTKINHSCDPNAIKFSPSAGSSGASEIWSVRDIREGEEITICYCEPLEMTRQSMHEFLVAHHRFICCCSVCESNRDPKREESDITEAQESQFQEMLQAMESELKFWRSVDENEFAGSFEGMAKLMKAANDISLAYVDGSGLQFISPRILARIFKLSANASALFLEKVQGLPEGHKKPKTALIAGAASSFFRSSVRLLQQQLKYLGSSHPDIGSTNNDIAQGLSCLLDSFPHELVDTLSSDCEEIRFCLDGPVPAMVATISAGGAAATSEQNNSAPAPIPASVMKAIRLLMKRAISRFQGESDRIQNLYSRRHYKALQSYRAALINSLDSCSDGSGARGGQPGSCYWGDFISQNNSD